MEHDHYWLIVLLVLLVVGASGLWRIFWADDADELGKDDDDDDVHLGIG